MKTIQIPGKVMLSGEYAVLYGGTAVMAPVPRYLNLTVSEDDNQGACSPIIEEALKYPIPELADYESANGKPTVAIDSSEFFDADAEGKIIKLGLGLSSAEAVGMIALRFERAGFEWIKNRRLIWEYADNVHRHVQRGLGSGADVAACAFGEPIKFCRKGDKAHVEPITMDQKYHKIPLRLIWTGMAADTRHMITRFADWLGRGGMAAENLLEKLIKSSHKLADSWFAEPADILFENLDIYTSIMTEIAGQADIQYSLPIHNEIALWAKHHGGRAKPTGAGGGDMILLVGDLPDQMPVNIPISIEI
jgi:phosphomevalonate kinase